MIIKDLIDALVEKHRQLEELKRQSPEMADAIQLAEQYHAICDEVRKQCSQVPMYPVAVYPDWTYRPQPHDWWKSPYKVTCGDSTVLL